MRVLADREKSGAPQRIRVLLVEDHPVMRQGLALLLERETDMLVCGEADDVASALRAALELRPDVVVVDITLKNSNGLDLIKELRRRAPLLPVLVFSIHDEAVYAERALQAGARGYVMKHEATEKLLDAIRCLSRGESYFSEHVQERVLRQAGRGGRQNRDSVQALSDRELQIFELVGRGLGTRVIAERLEISVKTVESHLARIKEKLDLKNHTELLQRATLWVSEEDRN